MTPAPVPLTRDLVLIGGGHAHALVLRRWGMDPLPGTRLTLINPGPDAPYTGMLPGFVAGHYPRKALDIDLVRLARFAGARLILGAVTGIDRAARVIHVPGRPGIGYDVASVNVGITSDLPSLPGFAEHGVAAKPLGVFARVWTDRRAAMAAGRLAPEVAVIGAGVGGIELAMAMAHALKRDGTGAARITVIERDTALPGMGRAARAVLLDELHRLGISLLEGAQAREVTAGTVVLDSGDAVPSRFTVGVAGARPFGWLADTGLDLHDGFVTVDATLRSTNDPAIFAVGDCAHLSHAPRPKAGVFAVREAPVLTRNLRAALGSGEAMRRYKPQRDYLKLVSLGGKSALADKYGLGLRGRWLWRWKDRIDRAFMDRLQDLPAMKPPSLPARKADGVAEALGDKPMCGGCGAKVGAGTLGAVLADLPAPARADILSRPGDDAAILKTGGAVQVVTTDHLRAFTEDPYTMARITAVHALGDIWAMGAKPQAAVINVILPRMAATLQDRTLREIMAGAEQALTQAGAAIVGGHTTLGAELTVGFTLTGLRDRPITLAGARPGDALILTKPLGSGTLLAAEMTMQARGRWIAALLDGMAIPQGAAARLLGGAHAMTDVTGFGLAGHLLAICEASGTGAEISLDRVPFYDGAMELAAQGVRSTIYPQNRTAGARMTLPDDPRADLLFDPQTAGGLLAAIAPDDADATVAALCQAGYRAARIGRVVDGPAFVTVR